MPHFPLEEIEDYYTYYVNILKIPEDIFWNADISFIERVVENKTAYEKWLRYAVKKAGERIHVR